MDLSTLIFTRDGQFDRPKIREALIGEGVDQDTIDSILKVIAALNIALLRRIITRKIALERVELVIDGALSSQHWTTPLTRFDTSLNDSLADALNRSEEKKKEDKND